MTGYIPSAFSLSPAILALAFLLDFAMGDPRWLPHPVRIMGSAISKTEALLRKPELTDRFKGIILVSIVVSLSFCITWLIVYLLSLAGAHILALISYFLFVYLTSTTIALRELIDSAGTVIKSVKGKDIGTARGSLGMIVGRDTKDLKEEGILKAAIETLSENLSDGIIAPIFYLVVGGLPLAMTYKAVNTLDSMVGYKNEKYKNFGWAAARLDDIANYIPARISGILIVIAASLLGIRDWGSGIGRKTKPQLLTTKPLLSLRTMFRDGRKHTSPNAGIPEAAMAGALGVRLGGPSAYGGSVVDKPYIGTDTAVDYLSASEKTITIVKVSSLLFVFISAVLLFMRNFL